MPSFSTSGMPCQKLADAGYVWLSDFSSVDLQYHLRRRLTNEVLLPIHSLFGFSGLRQPFSQQLLLFCCQYPRPASLPKPVSK